MPLLLGHLDRLLSFLRAVEGEKGEGQALPGGEGLGGDLAARATWWGRLVYWGHEGVCPRRAEAGGLAAPPTHLQWFTQCKSWGGASGAGFRC